MVERILEIYFMVYNRLNVLYLKNVFIIFYIRELFFIYVVVVEVIL